MRSFTAPFWGVSRVYSEGPPVQLGNLRMEVAEGRVQVCALKSGRRCSWQKEDWFFSTPALCRVGKRPPKQERGQFGGQNKESDAVPGPVLVSCPQTKCEGWWVS